MGEIAVLTSNAKLKEHLAESGLKVVGGAGDTRITWNPEKKDEVAAAKQIFDELKKKGFTFFKTGRGMKEGRRVDKWDASLGKLDAAMVAVPKMAGGSEEGFRDKAARILHKYVQAYKPYDGEFDQTLDALAEAAGPPEYQGSDSPFRFEFGDVVRDVTGFQGIITARTEWMNGCIRYQVEKVLPDGNVAEFWVDEARLEKFDETVKPDLSGVRVGGGRPTPSQPKGR